MCSRRAHLRPSILESTNDKDNGKLSIPQDVPTTPSPTSDTPKRKRVKNWRRSTGPLSPEDLQLAMLETEKEMRKGEETSEDEVYWKHQNEQGDSGNSLRITITDDGNDQTSMYSTVSSAGIFESSPRMDSIRRQTQCARRTCSLSYGLYRRSEEYQKLYELEKLESDALRDRVKYLETLLETNFYLSRGEQPCTDLKCAAEKDSYQRRVMQLEEQFKALESLRADNQRLKEENGALIRVISRLSK